MKKTANNPSSAAKTTTTANTTTAAAARAATIKTTTEPTTGATPVVRTEKEQVTDILRWICFIQADHLTSITQDSVATYSDILTLTEN